MDGLNELYREVILDHYQNPRRQGTLAAPTIIAEGKNPLCGDELTLHLGVEDGKISAVAWSGHGCSISMASASMLAEQLIGKPMSAVMALQQAVLQFLRGEPVPPGTDLGDLEVLEGVRKFPVRIKCALLPWTTLQEGCKHYDGHTTHATYTERD